jgi:hypothetical protein
VSFSHCSIYPVRQVISNIKPPYKGGVSDPIF